MINKVLKYFLGFFLLGVILISFTLSKYILFFVSVLFIFLASNEYRCMFKTQKISPHFLLPEISGSIFSYLFIFNNGAIEQNTFVIPSIILSLTASYIVTIITNKKPYFETSMSTIALILFIFCGLYIIKLPVFFDENSSLKLILVYFLAVLSGDYFASVIGPKNKKHFLSPDISPNKTVLGAIVNLLCSCSVCLILQDKIPIIECILIGITISVFSQLGDLTISTFKRNLNLKHSGNLFCDYGGIFDRIDAFIFSAPALYYLLSFVAKIN